MTGVIEHSFSPHDLRPERPYYLRNELPMDSSAAMTPVVQIAFVIHARHGQMLSFLRWRVMSTFSWADGGAPQPWLFARLPFVRGFWGFLITMDDVP
jgi:hypothetical protein